MTIEILVPDLPESVADATVATWHKKPGEAVERVMKLSLISKPIKWFLKSLHLKKVFLKQIIEEEGATVLSKQLDCQA